MDSIKRILFVCLGNTARSPAAEYLARYYAKTSNVDLIFESAGFINAFSYIQQETQDYLNSKNIDYSDFQPQLITPSLLKSQDLILTMEKSHLIDIINNYGYITNIKNKTFTLKEFNGETKDIDIIDPYYTSTETYRKVLKIIDDNVRKAVQKIIDEKTF
ncbi:MAG: low molecular weight protein arginine phosphatase [Promethearchaeota archaeon]